MKISAVPWSGGDEEQSYLETFPSFNSVISKSLLDSMRAYVDKERSIPESSKVERAKVGL